MTADERIAKLEEQLKQALEHISVLQEQLAAAQKYIEELEKQKTPLPAFVKINVKKLAGEEKKPRQKHDGQHHHGRLRAVPTQMAEHRIVNCPDCHLRLDGISLARVPEVIEVPEPPSVTVIHHRIFKGWCTTCQKWHEAPVALQREVLGQGRLGCD
jgi:transposase